MLFIYFNQNFDSIFFFPILSAPNDNYSASSLESVKDVIYINLFDEVSVNLLQDDAEKDTVVYERLERRWLGNFKIPFTTLYLNSKVHKSFLNILILYKCRTQVCYSFIFSIYRLKVHFGLMFHLYYLAIIMNLAHGYLAYQMYLKIIHIYHFL